MTDTDRRTIITDNLARPGQKAVAETVKQLESQPTERKPDPSDDRVTSAFNRSYRP